LEEWADNPELFRQRGEAHALRRRWPEAARDFRRAAELDPGDSPLARRAAALALHTGDVAGYRELCRGLLESCSRRSTVEWEAVPVCTLAPGAVADTAALVQLARRNAEESAGTGVGYVYQAYVGAALHRAGHNRQAVKALLESRATAERQNQQDNLTGPLLALAHTALGKTGEARAEFKKTLDQGRDDEALWRLVDAGEWNWLEVIEFRVLRDEAERLVGALPAAPP
jgi:hypothetical protein